MRGVLVVLALSVSPVAADHPMVAAPGCTFEWRGTGGYVERATSHGAVAFPLIAFSRADLAGGAPQPWIPFCGAACASAQGRAAIASLFPLEVGGSATVSVDGGVLSFVVAERAVVAPLGVAAFRVDTYASGTGPAISSWWSETLGWIVRYRQGSFEKTVVRTACPDPEAGS